jgi:hemolysin activation/secretion protein
MRLVLVVLLCAAALPVGAQQLSDLVPALPSTGRDLAPPDDTAPIRLGAAAPGDGATVVLRGVTLAGASAVRADQLEPLWADLIGQPVNLATLESLAEQIGASYRTRGFVLSQAFLPAQVVQDGVVEIRVVEGFIDRVAVASGAPNQTAAVGRRFEPVSTDRPARLQTIERAVLLSRDLLGGGVETVLESSPDTFAAADMAVLLDPPPPTGFLAADNRGSRLYGEASFVLGGVAHNLLGANERLELLVAGSPEGALGYVRGVAAFPVVPLDRTAFDGTMLEVEADYAEGDPDLTVAGGAAGLSLTTRETGVRVALRTPFIRTRAQNLYGHVQLDWRDATNVTSFGPDALSEKDRLLVFELGAEWDGADRRAGVTLVSGRLRQGLDTDRATVGGGAGAGETDFTLVSARVVRLQRLGTGPYALWVEGIGQFAAGVLPNSERFGLGDATIGRGFAPGNTTGDSGFGARVELRRSITEDAMGRLGEAAEVYGYVDYGRVRDRDPDRDGEQWEGLGSIGVGLRWDVTPRLTLTPEISHQFAGQPSDRDSTDRETRFYFGAVMRF